MSTDERPAHRHPRAVALVALGGALGALARQGVGAALPHAPGQLAWATFTVNVVGAFVLGALLEALTRSGPDEGRRRSLRLLLGTGFCGAFTTYSTFVHDAVSLDAGHAAAWAVGQVVCGVLAAAVGAWTGALLTKERAS